LTSITTPQKEIVIALLEPYDKKRCLVKSKEIAHRAGRFYKPLYTYIHI